MKSKPSPLKNAVFQNMTACSVETGWPLPILKRCRRAGCAGFRNGRVHFGEVVDFYFSTLATDHIDWPAKFARARAMREEIRLSQDQKQVIDYALVKNFFNEIFPVMFLDLDQVFKMELPPSLKGLSEIAIHQRCDTEIERLKVLWQNRLRQWRDAHEPPTKPEDTHANAKT
jgi:hypothetical protein